MNLKYAHIELERRFLYRALPAAIDPDKGFTRIIDRYVKGTHLRLRRLEDPSGKTVALKFAKKLIPKGFLPHRTQITNLYLDEQEYGLLGTLEANTLSKRRYPFKEAGHTYSIDVFEGPLAPLVLCEIEKRTEADLIAVPMPAGAVREVTADPFFTGGMLVRATQDVLKNKLAALRD